MSATLTIKIKADQAKQLVYALKKYPRIAEPILQKSLLRAQAELAKRTLKDDPIPWRTGNLLHSFRWKASRLKGVWWPTAPYARAVDQGARIPPRVIKPKKAQALYWPGALHPVKKVNHPGGFIKPRYFMKKLRNKSEDAVIRQIERGVQEITEKITKL